MPVLRSGGLEERIVNAVRENYPITLDELVALLKVGRDRVLLAVKRLAASGVIIMEELPDKTYLRPGRGVGFVGINPSQQKALKKKKGRKKRGEEDTEVEGYL